MAIVVPHYPNIITNYNKVIVSLIFKERITYSGLLFSGSGEKAL